MLIKRFLVVISVISLFMITPLFTNQAKSASIPQTPTREQVLENFLYATYGMYYYGNGAPFFPKGFPNWNRSGSEVRKILGDPSLEIDSDNGFKYYVYNSSSPYDSFEIILKDNKFVGVKTHKFKHEILCNSLYNLLNEVWTWTNAPSKSSDPYEKSEKIKPSEKVFQTRFALYSDYQPRYFVVAWMSDGGEEMSSYVTLRDVARSLGANW